MAESNHFEGQSFAQVKEAAAKMAEQQTGIFNQYKNSETGTTAYESITEDDSATIRDLNEKMAQATILIEKYQEMEGAEAKGVKLAEYMNTPADRLPQVKTRKGAGDFATQFMDSPLRERLVKGDRNIGGEFPLQSFGFKATTGEDAAQAGVDVDYPVRADRLGGVIDELFQQPNIADLIPTVTTGVDSVEYVTENYTDAAVETNEAAAVPESTADFTLVTEPVRKIGVAVKATEEVLSDVGLMRGLLQLRLAQDIRRREDTQLLSGNGVAPNLDGILNRAGVGNSNYSLAAGTDALIDAIRASVTVVQQAFQSPTAAIMNAFTWGVVEQVKDSQGNYLIRTFPSDLQPPRIWGQRVVLNENLANADTATNVPVLLGDWANSAMIARNGNISVAVSDSSETGDFLAGVLTFRATMREALIVHRASGFATVTVTA